MTKRKPITFEEVLIFLDTHELQGVDRIKLTSSLLKNLKGFPIDNVLMVNAKGAVFANGKVMNMEELGRFKAHVVALRENSTFKLLTDQILYNAIDIGVSLAHTNEQVLFSKTAIWFIRQFKEYLERF